MFSVPKFKLCSLRLITDYLYLPVVLQKNSSHDQWRFKCSHSCKDDRENEPNKQFSKSNSISVNSKNPWSCPSNLCMVKNIRFLRLSQTRCHRNVKIRHDESVISPAILLQGNRTRHYFYSMVTLIGVISKNVPVQIL